MDGEELGRSAGGEEHDEIVDKRRSWVRGCPPAARPAELLATGHRGAAGPAGKPPGGGAGGTGGGGPRRRVADRAGPVQPGAVERVQERAAGLVAGIAKAALGPPGSRVHLDAPELVAALAVDAVLSRRASRPEAEPTAARGARVVALVAVVAMVVGVVRDVAVATEATEAAQTTEATKATKVTDQVCKGEVEVVGVGVVVAGGVAVHFVVSHGVGIWACSRRERMTYDQVWERLGGRASSYQSGPFEVESGFSGLFLTKNNGGNGVRGEPIGRGRGPAKEAGESASGGGQLKGASAQLQDNTHKRPNEVEGRVRTISGICGLSTTVL